MVRIILQFLVTFLAMFSSLPSVAQPATPCPPAICAESEDGEACTPPLPNTVCATPGGLPILEGYGVLSGFGGGTNSESCVVTNLNDSGAGSYRSCIEDRNGPASDPSPRTVTFAVGGTIVLSRDLAIRQPYLTIDGLSAPAPGITIAKTGTGEDGESRIQTWPAQGTCGHDVLIQGIRFRGVWTRDTEVHSQNADNLQIDGEDLKGCLKNVVIWRNTFIDGQDTAGGIWGSVTDVTFGYNLVVYNLHPQQISHFPGGEAGQQRERISLHHNIYAYAHERLPNIRGNSWDIDIVQNIFHKWGAFGFGGGYATKFRCRGGGCPMRVNLLENHWTSGGSFLSSAISYEDGGSPNEIYMSGNIVPDSETDTGLAVVPFPSPNSYTVYSDNEFVTGMFKYVGHAYPTSEEEAVKNEVAQQVLSEL